VKHKFPFIVIVLSALSVKSYPQDISPEAIRARGVEILGFLGKTVEASRLTVAPRVSQTRDGHSLMKSWQVDCDSINVMMGFDGSGSLYFYSMGRRKSDPGNPRSDAQLWASGEAINTSFMGSNHTWIRKEVVAKEHGPSVAPESQGTVKLSWRDNRDDYPSPAGIDMTLDRNSGALVRWRCFIPSLYGPATAELSREQAWAKAKDYLNSIKERDSSLQADVERASNTLAQLSADLKWSKGGGGYGFDSAEKYFRAKELRLAYSWRNEDGEIEVDASTGELLSASFFAPKAIPEKKGSGEHSQGATSSLKAVPEKSQPPQANVAMISSILIVAFGGTWIGVMRWRGKKSNH
jgi:hypothetical protein